MKIFSTYGLIILLVALNISGCATSRMYSGPALQSDQVAFLERGDTAQILKQVDDNRSVNFFLLNSEVEILPGKHTISVGYGDGRKRGYPYTLTFTAKLGVRYVIKSNFINSNWKPSIIEKKSKIEVNDYPINLIPMYGYPDNTKTKYQIMADKQFIESEISRTGSREKSAIEFSAWGWSERQKKNIDNAMRRFNQSWLLDPNYYQPYWGFGAIAAERSKPKKASIYFEKSLELVDNNIEKARLLVDIARSYALQGIEQRKADPKKSDEFYNKANSSIDKAIDEDSKYSKAYKLGAIIAYEQGNYARSWVIIKMAKKSGTYKFDSKFISKLSKEMPEP